MALATTGYVLLLLVVPVIAWKLVPYVYLATGRPLEGPWPPLRPFWAYYRHLLGLTAVIAMPLALLLVWLIALLGVVEALS